LSSILRARALILLQDTMSDLLKVGIAYRATVGCGSDSSSVTPCSRTTAGKMGRGPTPRECAYRKLANPTDRRRFVEQRSQPPTGLAALARRWRVRQSAAEPAPGQRASSLSRPRPPSGESRSLRVRQSGFLGGNSSARRAMAFCAIEARKSALLVCLTW
jgi:hypothetical protein